MITHKRLHAVAAGLSALAAVITLMVPIKAHAQAADATPAVSTTAATPTFAEAIAAAGPGSLAVGAGEVSLLAAGITCVTVWCHGGNGGSNTTGTMGATGTTGTTGTH